MSLRARGEDSKSGCPPFSAGCLVLGRALGFYPLDQGTADLGVPGASLQSQEAEKSDLFLLSFQNCLSYSVLIYYQGHKLGAPCSDLGPQIGFDAVA